jgi:hypothetical protein
MLPSRSGIRIVHREPLGTVNGSNNAFVALFYNINPGLVATFPWLAQIAQSFETYKFNSLSIEFLTSASTASTGTNVIAPDYNAADTVAVSIQELEQFQDACRDVPWADIHCRINPTSLGALGPRRYIRVGALAPNLDVKTYDACSVTFASNNSIATNVVAGELWINYDVELDIPTSFNQGNTAFSGMLAATNPSIGNLAGTNGVSSGRLGVTVVADVVTVTNLIPGQSYIITYNVTGSTIGANPGMAFTSGSSNGQIVTLAFAASGAYLQSYFVATLNTATFTLSGVTSLTAGSFSNVLVSLIQPNSTLTTYL